MMRKRDGLTREEGFHALVPRAKEHVPDLLREFEIESDHGLRCWLLELFGEARSGEAFDLLCAQAQCGDSALRDWAIQGLKLLDTKAARTFLFQQGLRE